MKHQVGNISESFNPSPDLLLQVEVRNITKQISELNNKLDSVNQLSEPRENSYMMFCRNEGQDYTEHINNILRDVGSVKTSKTFPSLCRASLETVICQLETRAKLQTIDYNGLSQELGGDPVTAGNCSNLPSLPGLPSKYSLSNCQR